MRLKHAICAIFTPMMMYAYAPEMIKVKTPRGNTIERLRERYVKKPDGTLEITACSEVSMNIAQENLAKMIAAYEAKHKIALDNQGTLEDYNAKIGMYCMTRTVKPRHYKD